MFRVTTEPQAWIDHTWRGLDEDGYEVEKSIRLKVRFLPATEIAAAYSQEDGQTLDLADKVILDWAEIQGPDGKAFPFTQDNLALVMEHEPGFMREFPVNYVKAWGGQGRVREKNSGGSPDGGPAAEPEVEARKARSPSKTS